MQLELIIDNSGGGPGVINFLRAITEPTLLEIPPLDMVTTLQRLAHVPATMISNADGCNARTNGVSLLLAAGMYRAVCGRVTPGADARRPLDTVGES